MMHNNILIIGASGIVGQELISILLDRGADPTSIIPTASSQSAGKSIEIGGFAFVLQDIQADLFETSPLVFQCATNEAALEWIPIALKKNCQVIDCSSAYRQYAHVPLVIPYINGEELLSNPQLIAGPNCTTIVLLTAINILLKELDVQSITVSTYQALSGAGRAGLDALSHETAGNTPSIDSIFPEPCAGNIFCHESAVNSATGFNSEEEKVIAEIYKICNQDSLTIMPTCMRVPVERVHTESISLTFQGNTTKQEILALLDATPNVLVLDEESHFPTALKASGGDTVLVGHVRVSGSTISLVACGDQLRTGAALNAVRIAEQLNEEIYTHGEQTS